MRAFAVGLCGILAVWFLLNGGQVTPVFLAVAMLPVVFLMALPHARTQQYSARSTCILALVAIIGFLGIRLVKPFFEGYMGYSGPGSMGTRMSWMAHEIDKFKNDHGGKPPSPRGMWGILMTTSNSTELGDTPAIGTSYGPYFDFQSETINPLNGNSAVADKPAPGIGWVYKVTGTDYTLSAVNAKGDAVLSKDEAHLYYFRPEERAHVAAQRAWNNWGGLLFAIPLVVYWLALLGWRPSRRAWRIARGLCPICAYDLRAHLPNQNCPECGTQIPHFGWRPLKG